MVDYTKDVIIRLEKTKMLADKAIAQINDEDLFAAIDAENNSIAIIMKHMAGNMHSRWVDFLTSDREKPDRNRDSEFVLDEKDSKERLLNYWQAGWQCVFDALRALTVADLEKTITIRSERHSVIEAISRQLAHYSYHVGQIVLLVRHFVGPDWQTLSIAKGKSEAFINKMRQEQEAR